MRHSASMPIPITASYISFYIYIYITGDQVFVSDMRMIWMCESALWLANTDQSTPNFPVTRVRVYVAYAISRITIYFGNSYEMFGYNPWKRRVKTSSGIRCWLAICRHQNSYSLYIRNFIRRTRETLKTICDHHVIFKKGLRITFNGSSRWPLFPGGCPQFCL